MNPQKNISHGSYSCCRKVNESANTAQRYTKLDNEVSIDFARLGKPKPHFHNSAPALQAAAAVASNRSSNYTNKRNDMQQTPPNRVRSSNPPRPTMVPRLKDYVYTASDVIYVNPHSVGLTGGNHPSLGQGRRLSAEH